MDKNEEIYRWVAATSRTSTYSTTIYAGAKLNDVVTFTLRNYNYSATYKVEELLQNPAIVLR